MLHSGATEPSRRSDVVARLHDHLDGLIAWRLDDHLRIVHCMYIISPKPRVLLQCPDKLVCLVTQYRVTAVLHMVSIIEPPQPTYPREAFLI